MGLLALIRRWYRMLLGPYRRQWKVSVILSWILCQELLEKVRTERKVSEIYISGRPAGLTLTISDVEPDWLEVCPTGIRNGLSVAQRDLGTLVVGLQLGLFCSLVQEE